MYTQCPDCSTAFRISAEDLKKAAGKVRCGGCSNAFNAIEYLSEEMPEQLTAEQAEPDLPELTPEQENNDPEAISAISAEQSAALLKTLDELAGSDIRIEDTGVEWRVLDEHAIAAREADNHAQEVADHDDKALSDAVPSTVDELRFDDDTPLPDNFDLDDEALYLPDSSDVAQEEDAEPEQPPEIDEPQLDVALGEPEDWSDILGEFDEDSEEDFDSGSDEDFDDAPDEDLDDSAESDFDYAPDEIVDEGAEDVSDEHRPLDVDTQFALQAEAMGIEVSGVRELEDEVEDDAVAETGDEFEEDRDDWAVAETNDEFEENVARLDKAEEADESIVEHPTIQDELDALDELESDDDAPQDDDEPEPPFEHDVAALGEEEESVNMMIDQELMALASEDEDGFETIIMEGDVVSADNTLESLTTDTNEAAEQAKLPGDIPHRVAVVLDKIREHAVAVAIGLAALLLLQGIHQSRDAMATSPAFNNTVGAVYKAIGQPLEPDWDITGWRFEATKGSVDDQIDATFVVNESLTIYSRIGNTSEQMLPYPLIGVSLTDRFEETIGSRIMSPVDYLPKDANPDVPVQPGDSFDAVIAVQSSTEEATGFKLNVCYRSADNQLRCAIEDFR